MRFIDRHVTFIFTINIYNYIYITAFPFKILQYSSHMIKFIIN